MHRKALPLDPWPNSRTGGTRWGAWPGARPGIAGKPGLGQGGLDERAVQPHADRRYLPGRAPGLLPRLRVALSQGGRDHLLDERHLALDRGPDGPQVPGLDAIPAEHGGGRRGPGGVPLGAPPRRGTSLHRAPRRRQQPLLDHPERQVLVTLGRQDVPEPLHVGLVEPAVVGRRAGRLDQPLRLQKPDLGHADVRKLRAKTGDHLADAEVRASRLCAHPPTCAPPPPCSACEYGPSRNTRRNLPTCTSSPPVRSVSSIRSRFTYVPLRLPTSRTVKRLPDR